jgi:hypothetical protein
MRRYGLACLVLLASAPTWAATSAWTVVPTPNRGSLSDVLNGVTVVGGNAFAVGHYYDTGLAVFRTLTLRWDGSAWRLLSSPNVGTGYNDLYSVSGTGPNDVWAVGYSQRDPYTSYTRPLVMHWDGARWQAVSTNVGDGGLLVSVRAIAPNDVWAVGSLGRQALVLRWNGSQWTRVAVPTNSTTTTALTGVAGVTSDDVWVVGSSYVNRRYQNLIEHWDGRQWKIVPCPSPSTRSYLGAVAAVRRDEAWAVGYVPGSGSQILRWDGTRWTAVSHPNSGTLWSVAADGSNVWAAGYRSDADGYTHTLLQRWDGSRWTVEDAPSPGISQSISAVGAGDGAVWAVGLKNEGSADRTLSLRGSR